MDQFVFKSNSAKAIPGKGIHEKLSGVNQYDLPDDFRSILSNFHHAVFEWTGADILTIPFPKGTKFNSIEHAFQASKFMSSGYPDIALKFTVGYPIGNGTGADAQKNRKLVKLSNMDIENWDSLSRKVMESAAKAKYAQNPESMKVLQATAPATLMHLVVQRGKPSILDHFKHLEDIRDC